MKKFGIMVVVLAMLVGMTGFAMADAGVNATPETIGISTVGVVSVQGAIVSKTDLTMKSTSMEALTAVPPMDMGTYYAATYNDDVTSTGVGLIDMTKTMDVDTNNMLVNQYNIEAFKVLNFLGDGTSRIVSTENIFVDGTGMPIDTKEVMICVLAPAKSDWLPAFCNLAEAGSSVDMLVGSVTTGADTRFIMKSADPGVVLDYNIRVIDTIGKASAYMEVFSQEAKGTTLAPFSEVKFREDTSVDGFITLFDKKFAYESKFKR
jgi:hypothetical protein